MGLTWARTGILNRPSVFLQGTKQGCHSATSLTGWPERQMGGGNGEKLGAGFFCSCKKNRAKCAQEAQYAQFFPIAGNL